MRWNRGPLGLYAQYTRGFRAPPFSDVNIGLNLPTFNYIALPNPDLKPEVITTFETVFTWQARADTQWQLSLFKYDMKDIIRSTGLPAIRANSGRQSGEGFELARVDHGQEKIE